MPQWTMKLQQCNREGTGALALWEVPRLQSTEEEGKSVVWEIHEQADKLHWLKRNDNSWFCSWGLSSWPAVWWCQNSCTLWQSNAEETFAYSWQLLLYVCFCLFGDEIGIKEGSPVNLFIMPSICLCFLCDIFLSLKASSATLCCCDDVTS